MAEVKRTYTIPLRRGYANTPRHKRTHKAVRVLKLFLAKHMKSEDVKIGKYLNEHLWQNGMRNPPSKVKVIAVKDTEGLVRVELEGKQYHDFKVKEKVDTNQTFKEKLKSKVAEAKGGVSSESKVADSAASERSEEGKDSDKEQKKKTLTKKESGSKETKTTSSKAPAAKDKVPPPKETEQKSKDKASAKN